jgi:hypothetical protein
MALLKKTTSRGTHGKVGPVSRRCRHVPFNRPEVRGDQRSTIVCMHEAHLHASSVVAARGMGHQWRTDHITCQYNSTCASEIKTLYGHPRGPASAAVSYKNNTHTHTHTHTHTSGKWVRAHVWKYFCKYVSFTPHRTMGVRRHLTLLAHRTMWVSRPLTLLGKSPKHEPADALKKRESRLSVCSARYCTTIRTCK